MEGFIILHRKLINWEWCNDSKMFHLFIMLLLKANHKPQKWQGNLIDRGQLATGLHKLSAQTGMSIQSIRTCLGKLESTQEITIESTNKFSLITIVKYDDYQTKENKLTSKSTNQQQTINKPTNKQTTTNNNENNYNNENNEKKKEIKEKNISISHSSLNKKKYPIPVIGEVKEYFVSKGYSEAAAQNMFDYYVRENWTTKRGNPVEWKDASKMWFEEKNEIKKQAPIDYMNGLVI